MTNTASDGDAGSSSVPAALRAENRYTLPSMVPFGGLAAGGGTGVTLRVTAVELLKVPGSTKSCA